MIKSPCKSCEYRGIIEDEISTKKEKATIHKSLLSYVSVVHIRGTL